MGSWHQIQFDCQNYAKNAIVLLFLAIILHGFDKKIRFDAMNSSYQENIRDGLKKIVEFSTKGEDGGHLNQF